MWDRWYPPYWINRLGDHRGFRTWSTLSLGSFRRSSLTSLDQPSKDETDSVRHGYPRRASERPTIGDALRFLAGLPPTIILGERGFISDRETVVAWIAGRNPASASLTRRTQARTRTTGLRHGSGRLVEWRGLVPRSNRIGGSEWRKLQYLLSGCMPNLEG